MSVLSCLHSSGRSQTDHKTTHQRLKMSRARKDMYSIRSEHGRVRVNTPTGRSYSTRQLGHLPRLSQSRPACQNEVTVAEGRQPQRRTRALHSGSRRFVLCGTDVSYRNEAYICNSYHSIDPFGRENCAGQYVVIGFTQRALRSARRNRCAGGAAESPGKKGGAPEEQERDATANTSRPRD